MLINHKVEPKDFKAVFLFSSKLVFHTGNSKFHYLFHLVHDLLFEIAFHPDILQVTSELVERELVPVFKLRVLETVLLDGVIGEVNEWVIDVLHFEAFTTRSYVPFLEVVAYLSMRDQAPHSDIELTALNQKWVFNVLLNDEIALWDDPFKLFKVGEYFNTSPAIQVNRFQDPVR